MAARTSDNMARSTLIVSSFNNTSDDSSRMLVKFPRPQKMNDDSKVGLGTLIAHYSWYNITAAFGNNTISYNWQGVQSDIVIPDGFYSTAALSAYLQSVMKANGHYLVDGDGNDVFYISLATNITYYGVTLTCDPVPLTTLPSGYTNPATIVLDGNCPLLVVTNQLFGNLLGFTAATMPAVTQNTQYAVNNGFVGQIHPVTAVIMHCSLVGSGSGMNSFPQAIAVFTPTVGFASQIILDRTANPFMFPVAAGSYDEVEIRFTDQQGRALAIRDPETTIVSLVVET